MIPSLKKEQTRIPNGTRVQLRDAFDLFAVFRVVHWNELVCVVGEASLSTSLIRALKTNLYLASCADIANCQKECNFEFATLKNGILAYD